jgi:hypothetical protein
MTWRECLDQLLIHGERHLLQILGEYSRHYNMHRPHQSREQRPPLHEPGQTIDMTARIKRRQVVNGLINEYGRAAYEPRKRQLRASVRVLARHRALGCPGPGGTDQIAGARGTARKPSTGLTSRKRSTRGRELHVPDHEANGGVAARAVTTARRTVDDL